MNIRLLIVLLYFTFNDANGKLEDFTAEVEADDPKLFKRKTSKPEVADLADEIISLFDNTQIDPDEFNEQSKSEFSTSQHSSQDPLVVVPLQQSQKKQSPLILLSNDGLLNLLKLKQFNARHTARETGSFNNGLDNNRLKNSHNLLNSKHSQHFQNHNIRMQLQNLITEHFNISSNVWQSEKSSNLSSVQQTEISNISSDSESSLVPSISANNSFHSSYNENMKTFQSKDVDTAPNSQQSGRFQDLDDKTIMYSKYSKNQQEEHLYNPLNSEQSENSDNLQDSFELYSNETVTTFQPEEDDNASDSEQLNLFQNTNFEAMQQQMKSKYSSTSSMSSQSLHSAITSNKNQSGRLANIESGIIPPEYFDNQQEPTLSNIFKGTTGMTVTGSGILPSENSDNKEESALPNNLEETTGMTMTGSGTLPSENSDNKEESALSNNPKETTGMTATESRILQSGKSGINVESTFLKMFNGVAGLIGTGLAAGSVASAPVGALSSLNQAPLLRSISPEKIQLKSPHIPNKLPDISLDITKPLAFRSDTSKKISASPPDTSEKLPNFSPQSIDNRQPFNLRNRRPNNFRQHQRDETPNLSVSQDRNNDTITHQSHKNEGTKNAHVVTNSSVLNNQDPELDLNIILQILNLTSSINRQNTLSSQYPNDVANIPQTGFPSYGQNIYQPGLPNYGQNTYQPGLPNYGPNTNQPGNMNTGFYNVPNGPYQAFNAGQPMYPYNGYNFAPNAPQPVYPYNNPYGSYPLNQGYSNMPYANFGGANMGGNLYGNLRSYPRPPGFQLSDDRIDLILTALGLNNSRYRGNSFTQNDPRLVEMVARAVGLVSGQIMEELTRSILSRPTY